MASYDYGPELLSLMKSEGNLCMDCSTPSPQWCSLSFGTMICLSCSGLHRSMGTHISFVRSLTMDKWTSVQVNRMKLGGNDKCKAFFEASTDYNNNMSIQDKYNSHFASQYREKLLAESEGIEWTPSAKPISQTNALRKPRTTNSSRNASPAPQSSYSDYNGSSSNNPSPNLGGPSTQKSKNEDYFASMGSANEGRSESLPPSQGGKYGGFGSDANYNPSNATSSRSIPSVNDFRDDPVGGLTKGWGFMASALGAAGRSINEAVNERAADPQVQAQFSQFSSYLNQAGSVLAGGARKAGEVASAGLQTGGAAIRRETGVDVGDLGSSYLDRISGRGAGAGYGRVGIDSGNIVNGGEQDQDDFFESNLGDNTGSGSYSKDKPIPPPVIEGSWASAAKNGSRVATTTVPAKKVVKTEAEEWGEEW